MNEQQIDDTHRLIRGIYRCSRSTQFHRESLVLLLDAIDGHRGCVVHQSTRDRRPHLVADHPIGACKVSVTTHFHTFLQSKGVWHLGVDMIEAFDLDPNLSWLALSASHQGNGASAWLLAADQLPADLDDWASYLPTHLGYAGEVARTSTVKSVRSALDERTDRQTRPHSLHGLDTAAAAAVRLAARGYTNQQIAEHQAISSATVARNLNRAYRHLGVSGRRDLDVEALLEAPKPRRKRRRRS